MQKLYIDENQINTSLSTWISKLNGISSSRKRRRQLIRDLRNNEGIFFQHKSFSLIQIFPLIQRQNMPTNPNHHIFSLLFSRPFANEIL